MIGRLVGALVGRELGRREGAGSLKGAAVGTLALGVLRRMGPLGWAIGGAYVAKQALDRRRERRDQRG